ncbi:MAG: hypothetical protein KJ077_17175 [Anaerolineae bacterium]|nr:hypothetical protein [Anaerolineae bacterium]
MVGAFFSPLAPAVVLLLGAFILPLVVLQFSARWQKQSGLRYLAAPVLVGLAAAAVLGVRLTFGADVAGEGLELLSGWDFSTPETVTTLTIRADTLSLPFLLLTVLILLAVTLATPLVIPTPPKREENVSDLAIWLALGAGAAFLFVSANGLTLVYAVLGFDVLTMFYWLQRGQRELSIARLLLGVFSVVALMLASLAPAQAAGSGSLWVGLALWLRLGLYPFIEANAHTRWQDYGGLAYLGLSLMVGIYLAARVMPAPLTGIISWAVVIFLLLNGLLAWLADEHPMVLIRLMLVEAAIPLLVTPLSQEAVTASTVGLILSVVVLWITPRLGQPRLSEGAWSWPYLPAIAATLTLIGLPFSLGWLARTTVYQALLLRENTALLLAVVLAEGLVLSGLVRYWLRLWQGDEHSERRSIVAIVVMVPFLIPGLAPLILSALTRTNLPPASFAQPAGVFGALGVTLIGAFGLGYFRPQLIPRLRINPAGLAEFAGLGWLLPWWAALLNWLGKFILLIRIILEGQHYMGWALFAALIGILIILLGA